MSPEARERSFDELARGLASGNVTRGKALRLMGAAVVGGVLASVPRVAAAQEVCPSASACCSCKYAEPDNPDVITRRRCFPLTTRSCGQSRLTRLSLRCETKCKEKTPSGLVLRHSLSRCALGSNGFQAFCGAGGARPSVCSFEPC
jgi:hypothetical protein